MKKTVLILLCLIIMQGMSFAKDILQFDFPNDGWHKIESPDGVKSKKCYVPVNENAQNYHEMVIFFERIIKNEGLNAMVLLNRQLGKDRNNYKDIYPKYVVQNENNSMAVWCSESRNICSVERAFKGNEGIVFAIYINKMPHYSQNMFSQWSNILGRIEIFDKTSKQSTRNLIELD